VLQFGKAERFIYCRLRWQFALANSFNYFSLQCCNLEGSCSLQCSTLVKRAAFSCSLQWQFGIAVHIMCCNVVRQIVIADRFMCSSLLQQFGIAKLSIYYSLLCGSLV
jgi:hypothetical protein